VFVEWYFLKCTKVAKNNKAAGEFSFSPLVDGNETELAIITSSGKGQTYMM
jgi:hypothetical protein